jgi:hypothetical protein
MSEEMAYQSQEVVSEPVETNEQPIQQEQTETPATTQDIPQAFRVKYNKEEIEVPYEQAPEYIQKGLNYEKVQQRVSEYEQHLNRVAQLTGYQTHEELLRALDEAEKERERQKYQEAGIDPEKFQELVSELPEIKQFREIQRQQEEQQRFQQEVNELFEEFPDLKPEQIPAEAWRLKEQKGLSLLDAYLRTTYKTLSQQKEQEAIQKLQQNAQASPGALGGGDTQHNANISSMTKTDFAKLVERVKRGENVQL